MTPYRKIGPVGLAGAIAYACILAVAQVLVVAPAYEYQGFTTGHPSPWALTIAALSYLMSASHLPRELTRPSQIVYWVLFLFVVAPTHVTPLLLDLAGRPNPLPIITAISAAFTALSLIYRVQQPRFLTSGLPARLFWTVAGGLTVGTLGLVIYGYGLHLRLPAFGEVYSVRLEYRQATESVRPLSSYSVTWAGEVLGPLLFAAGLVYTKLPLIAASVGCQLVIYSLTGFKSVTMLILLISLLAIMSRRDVRNMAGPRLAWSAFVGTAVITIYDLYQRAPDLSTIFTRRLTLAPGLLTYLYYDHFLDLPKLHLDYSVLSGFSANPYTMSPAEIIGRAYFGPQDHANANLWADGYANFGLLGVVVVTVMLGVFLLVFDGIAQTRDLRLSSLLIVAPGFALVNSALLTTLLTHGLLLALVLVLLMPTGRLLADPSGVPVPTRAHESEAQPLVAGYNLARPTPGRRAHCPAESPSFTSTPLSYCESKSNKP